jgi:hypothetical protein
LFEGVVRDQRRVERQAARTEQPGSLDELGDRVASARGAELLIDVFLFLRHPHDRSQQVLANALEVGRGAEALSFSLEEAPGEHAAFVHAGVCQRVEKIVEPRGEERDGTAQDQFAVGRAGGGGGIIAFERTEDGRRLRSK